MSNEQLTATITRALLTGLVRHGRNQYGTVVDVPPTVARGRYDKVTGYFGLVDVAQEIATAVEAALRETPK
jgi:hypothetical protein